MRTRIFYLNCVFENPTSDVDARPGDSEKSRRQTTRKCMFLEIAGKYAANRCATDRWSKFELRAHVSLLAGGCAAACYSSSADAVCITLVTIGKGDSGW